MSKFEEIYNIRLAEISDVDEIMNFIKREWKEDHIFAVNREFFLYEHQFNGKINFVLAINKLSNRIEAIQGFIRYSKELEGGHICPVISKVSSNVRIPFLGMELHKKLKEYTKSSTFFGVGTNPRTMAPLVKKIFNRHVGMLNHFYILGNKEKKEFKIASVNQIKYVDLKCPSKQYEFYEINSFEEINRLFDFNKKYNNLPYKDSWYIEKRYFKHPIYTYKVFAIGDEKEQIRGVIFAREITINGAKILRYVDFVGEITSLNYIRKSTELILREKGYEYIDFYSYGIDKNIMINAGFVFKCSEDHNIIPNYFEPFVQQNIEIWFETEHTDMAIFKGDSDQDRPNYTV